MRPAAWGALLLACACSPTYAQRTDSLQEVRIRSGRVVAGDGKTTVFAPGLRVVAADSAVLAQYRRESVAALLSQQLPVFVKTYGTNGPATVTFRGASSAQSLVLWDGIPLQQAALGVTDVSLLPVSFVGGVQVVYGGSAALLGSGNVGGALLLQSEVPRFDTGGSHTVELALGGGSFGRLNGFAGGQVSQRRSAYSWRLFGERSANDFPYQTAAGTTVRLANSQLAWGGLQAAARYQRRSGTWGTAVWLQAADRHIPPALFEGTSAKRQQDVAWRLRGDWQQQRSSGTWAAKLAYLYDGLRYDDSLSAQHSDLGVHKVFGEAAWRRSVRGWHLLLFMPVQVAALQRPAGDWVTQTSVAAAGALTRVFWASRLTASASLRGEHIDDRQILLPGVNASLRVLPTVLIRGNVQRTYRAPTLNERYYQPGGNPELVPEQGWNVDAGLHWEAAAGPWRWVADAAAFDRRIQNWILWFGGSIWTPHNIAAVRSRGFDGDAALYRTLGGTRISLRGSASYVDARTVESQLPGDGSVGKQIPYTPRWNARTGFGVARRFWSLDWSLAHTGERYVTSDESLALLPYTTQQLAVSCSLPARHAVWGVLARCENLTDVPYTVVSGRPAPGRSYSLTLSFRWAD